MHAGWIPERMTLLVQQACPQIPGHRVCMYHARLLLDAAYHSVKTDRPSILAMHAHQVTKAHLVTALSSLRATSPSGPHGFRIEMERQGCLLRTNVLATDPLATDWIESSTL